MLHAFRRYPPTRLRRVPVVGGTLARVYELIDVRGWLSDFIADPQILYERMLPSARSTTRAEGRFPEVSVIMATRNNGDTIAAAIRSILHQRGVSVELIVVDDGSTDHSVTVVKEIAEIDRRVRLLLNGEHRGTGYSRNQGMAAAQGEFITFQDGDDSSHPLRPLKQISALRSNPTRKIVTCNYVRVDENGARLRINDRRTMKCMISMMFPRQETLDKVGYFREDSVSEDADYYERIKIAFGKQSEAVLFRTLYSALFRPSSSFFQSARITSYDGRTVMFERRTDAQIYWEALRAQHEEMKRGERSPFIPLSEHSVGAAE